ncbi:MAG: nicotinate-nucleotide adenylyltransferase [Miltoncostaeaceae bacterium]
MSRRVGILGGTFDPPHIGHVVVANEAADQLDLDPVLLVPSARPPNKPEGALIDAAVRAELVAAAVAGHPRLEMWPGEIDREGMSYTADTVEQLAAERPGAELWFILGADQLREFHRWRDPERILVVARLAAVARSGDDPAEAAARLPASARVDVVHVPRIDVSSTAVRRRMIEGGSIDDLVPPAVAAALKEKGLVASPPPQ